jgi:alpha-glucosidase
MSTAAQSVTAAIGPDAVVSPGDGGDWWRDAVVYQIYPRSFADADGNGMGDLPGITGRLDALAELGVDAVWLSPFYRSPQADAGYDVADYRDVDPRFGTLADFDAMLARAHELGLRLIVDLVPNHSSDRHRWFVQALAAAPGSPERDRYLFRDGRGPGGAEPPNNWLSVFGGPAWTRTAGADGTPGQWYLHLFDPHQPDFNWDNAEVRAEFEAVLRFWLDRGVDGFRVDVAHGLLKQAGLPDYSPDPELGTMGFAVPTAEGDPGSIGDGSSGGGEGAVGGESSSGAAVSGGDEVFGGAEVSGGDEVFGGARPAAERASHLGPMWDQDGIHEIYREWRRTLDKYSPPRIMVAEAWVQPLSRLSHYVRSDEMHQAFNFDFLEAPWDAPVLRAVITRSLAVNASVGATTTWVLSNHDVVRHPSRFGFDGSRRRGGIGADDPQPDAALGIRRARAATLTMLALPGSAYLYQGEELGLPEHTTLPDSARQDPTWERSGHTERGRDGCRVPIPWQSGAPALGFSPTGKSWLPQPESFSSLARDRQQDDPDSTLTMYRSALRLRREHGLGLGELSWLPDIGAQVVAFRNGAVTALANLGPEPIRLPAGQVLLASAALPGDGTLPVDTAVWLR